MISPLNIKNNTNPSFKSSTVSLKNYGREIANYMSVKIPVSSPEKLKEVLKNQVEKKEIVSPVKAKAIYSQNKDMFKHGINSIIEKDAGRILNTKA